MIVAKAVIPNQYWILKQDDRKIGNIESAPGGFQVRINDRVEVLKTIGTIKRRINIDFEPAIRKVAQEATDSVYGYPTTHPPHNAVYDVRHQVPLYTREPRSKSWYAAGWFRIRQGRSWTVTECPKLITLERYQYQGPFRTREEAQAHELAHQ
jgi:hypothetical protein